MSKNRHSSVFQQHFAKLLLACFFLVGSAFSALAVPLSGTYTINKNTPTSGTNFASFADAVFALEGGVSAPVTFNVVQGSGPYVEQVTIFEVPGATALTNVTFKCNGETLQFAGDNPLLKAGIILDGADYITFDSLTVKCLGTDDVDHFGYGFNLLRDADNNVIRKCTILNLENIKTPQTTAGIMINGFEIVGESQILNKCDSNLITQNTIIGGYEGIVIDGWANGSPDIIQVFNNKINFNTIKNVQNTSIKLLWTNNTVVEGNDISSRFYSEQGFGMWVIEANYNLSIIGNRFHDFVTDPSTEFIGVKKAIDLGYVVTPVGQENIIANNLFYNLNAISDFTAIGCSGSTSNLKIYHNTFSFDDVASTSSNPVYGLHLEDPANTAIKFFDNIVSITGNGTGQKLALLLDAAIPDFTSDYNDIYLNTTNSHTGKFAGAVYTSVASWNATTNLDLHSIAKNPEYVNLAAGNLKPSNAVMDNYGKYVNVDRDIADTVRPNTRPDMGAYEFLSLPCSVPAVAGTVVSLPSASVCAATPLLITLEGNSAGKGQTYQWQTSETENGTYTNVGTKQEIPPYETTSLSTLYYRAEVTCETSTVYSVPLKIVSNGTLAASTFTINSALPTSGSNFKTFNDALSILKCGIGGPIVLNVVAGSGPYNEQLIIPAIPGTSATNTVTFNGNGETLTYRSTASLQRAVIKLNGADYFKFDNLKIAATGGSGAYGYGVQLINDADNNTISNCTITISDTTNGSTAYAGIVVSASHNNPTNTTTETNLCDNNTFTGNSIYGGIYGIVVTSAVAPNNVTGYKITNNKIWDFYQYGVYIAGTSNTLIEGNDIARPNRAPVPNSTRQNSETFHGIYATNKNTSLVISKNRIHDPAPKYPSASGANGIYLNSCDAEPGKENIISNNVIYNFAINGGIVGIYNNGSDSAWYYHNTIALNAQNFTGSSTTRGFYQTSTASGLVFKNNLVSITRTGTGKKHGIYMSAVATTYQADNNNYYINSPQGNNFAGYFNTDFATLNDWKTGSGKDAHSLDYVPFFIDTLTANYTPMNMSLDNAGTPVGVTTDINGLARSGTLPDVGAYEFQGTLPITLVSISAAKVAADVIVSWTSATELNSKAYEIERSLDGANYKYAGTVNAKGAGNYSFADANAIALAANGKLYYRLKMIDKDGRYKHSAIVSVTIGKEGSIKVFPNPFVSELNASVTASRAGTATASIKNATGSVISIQTMTLLRGSNVIRLNNVSQLPKGVYMITIQNETDVQTFKIIK
jgi:hypothetical protein